MRNHNFSFFKLLIAIIILFVIFTGAFYFYEPNNPIFFNIISRPAERNDLIIMRETDTSFTVEPKQDIKGLEIRFTVLDEADIIIHQENIYIGDISKDTKYYLLPTEFEFSIIPRIRVIVTKGRISR
jgi:hypothetical protein